MSEDRIGGQAFLLSELATHSHMLADDQDEHPEAARTQPTRQPERGPRPLQHVDAVDYFDVADPDGNVLSVYSMTSRRTVAG